MRLIAENLICMRGGRTVFSDLSFVVEAGEIVQVTGRNGAGKSSLLRLIAGLVPAEGGVLRLESRDNDASLTAQCHYCGHQDAFKPALSVEENLAFWIDWLGGDAAALDAALDRLGILHLADLPAGRLSAGQKRRLALARLIAVQRPLWLLDEPTAALDTASQGILTGLLHDHSAQGGMALIATHMPLGLPARDLRIGP